MRRLTEIHSVSSMQRVHETPPQDDSVKKRKLSKQEDGSLSDVSSDSTVASTEENAARICKFRVSKESLSCLSRKGIDTFFPIQFRTFDSIYDGKHVVGRARTGTGKTLAFSLPSIEALMEGGSFKKKGVLRNECRMLVLLPTRELAQQVAVEIEALECGRFKSCAIVGGLPEEPQLRALKQGGNIVIGTPGRILDFLNRKLLHFQKTKVVVLDEADQMLEMGFRDDVDAILEHVFIDQRKKDSVQVLLFSATLPSWVNSISEQYMTGREKVTVDVVKGEQNQTATGIRHLGIVCGFHQRTRVLSDLLHLYAGTNGRCIVFTQTKAHANQIAVDSSISHFCQVLHGDIQQKQREITLKAFKDGRFRCLVATDVAARGLHVDDIELVVQMEPPKDVDTFVHRSGRTGRAGSKGTSIVFFNLQDAPFLMSIEQSTGIKFRRVGVPQPDELMRSTAQRMADSLLKSKKSNGVDGIKQIAENMIEQLGPVEAVSRLLCELGGTGKSTSPLMSTLSGREGFKTYEMLFKHVAINHKGYVWKALTNAVGENENIMMEKLTSMILRSDGKGCVFDVPEEILEKWENVVEQMFQNPKNEASFSIAPVGDLPELSDPLMDSSAASVGFSTKNPRALGRNGSRGGNGFGRGGSGRGNFGRGGGRGGSGRGFGRKF